VSLKTGNIVRLFIWISIFCAVSTMSFADEPTRVDNSSNPVNGSRTVELEELWTIGGEDSDLIFGVINRILIDEQENIYLLDGQLSEVHVVSPEGEHLRTLGREGDGPGEFRFPSEMAFLPDGTLGVLQGVPGKVVKLNKEDGTPGSSWPLSNPETGGLYQMQGMRVGGDEVVVGGVHQVVNQSTGKINRDSFLAYVDGNTGLVRKEIARRNVELDLTNLVLDENQLAGGPENRFDVLPDGGTVVGIPRDGYEVSIFSPDGVLERVFTRKFSTWQRDDHAYNIWKRILETVERNQAPGAKLSWEKTEPDIQSISTSPDGKIWILNSRGRWVPPENVFLSFDVFDSEGVYLEEVQFVCEGNGRRDMLFFSGGNLVFKVGGFWDATLAQFGGLGVTIDEDEEPQPVTVTCFKMK